MMVPSAGTTARENRDDRRRAGDPMTRATGWDARDAKFAGHRALVQENDGASGVLYRWECSCRKNGTWTSSRVQADKNGRRHETSKNAKSTKAPSEFRKGLQDLLRLG